jgi:enoyl-CoA hydratase
MTEPHVLTRREGHVVVVTMNRPAVLNAMDLRLLAELADAWDMIDGDDDVRVAVLTGAGGNFSSGADLKLMHKDQSDSPWHARFREDPNLHWKSFLRDYRLKKPLVAAVEGIAFGGGTEILQASDIRVAGQSARFALSEVKWGLYPLGGSVVRLARQIPYTKAAEILLTGRSITAQEALDFGLIGSVVPDGQALGAAMKLAARIAQNGPLAVQGILRSLREGESLSEEEALARDLAIGWPVHGSDDAKEGARAFREKRTPEFQGT